jgi:hypothetical protein
MAGRLGVLRKLVGVEGSLLAVQLDGASAESLRSSPSQRWVRRRADALGPGEVRGRRTLLSHARDAGLLEEEEVLGALGVADAVSAAEAAATATATASLLMAGVRRNLPS